MLKLKMKNEKLKIIIKNSKFLILNFIFTFCILNFTFTCFAEDKIIAIVNSDVITQKDLNDFINFTRVQLMGEFEGEKLETKIQSMKLDLIDKLIEDRLILQEAKKNNIRIDENRIKAKIEEIRKRYDSDREFQTALAKQGLVQADIESKIRDQLLMYTIIEIKIKSKIIVNPGEVTDFYQQNPQKFKIPEQRESESLAIAAEDENLVSEVLNKLKSGQEFRDVAKKYSLVVNKIGATPEGQLRKDIEDKIFKLQLGEISEAVKIEEQYYIFKLDNIIPPRQQSLSEAQDGIYTFLFNKKMEEALAAWLDELKKHSYIKILTN